jgi:hypothetical protein
MDAAIWPALVPVATAAIAAATSATCTDTVMLTAGSAAAATVDAPAPMEDAAAFVASRATSSLMTCLQWRIRRRTE